MFPPSFCGGGLGWGQTGDVMKKTGLGVTVAAILCFSPVAFAKQCTPTSLLVTATAVSNLPAAPPPDFNVTQTAGNDFTLYLTAYNASDCGVVTHYQGKETIRFYTTYVNPTSGTVAMSINGSNIGSSASATQTTQSITFTNGVATITGNYKDAGKLILNVADTSMGGPTGASGYFIVVPAKFAINVPNSTVTTCDTDPAFSKAGVGFRVNVQAQTAQGVVTPNFGNETTAEGILLTSGALLAPSGGRNGSTNSGVIANGSAFTKVSGSGSPFTGPYFTGNQFSFDEVGCISLIANIASGDYLSGGGNVIGSTVVGRFTPDHFSVSGNIPEFSTVNNNTNGSFTYLGQSFNYLTFPALTVTANAASGTITQNYTGSFWKLNNNGFAPSYSANYYPVNAGDSIPTQTLTGSVGTPDFADNANGTGTYTFSAGTGLQIQKPASSTLPFTAEISMHMTTITDSDGILCTGAGCLSGGYAFGQTTAGNGILFSGRGVGNGKQFLYGRLTVLDALGPETTSLAMPMQIEYYTNQGFVLNTFDSTTVFTGGASSLILTPSPGVATTPTFSGTPVFVNGVLNINLSAPHAAGYVTVEANLTGSGANLTWLEYPWFSSTTGDPVGRATFGENAGNPRIIFKKEKIVNAAP